MVIKTVEFMKSGVKGEHYPEDGFPEYVFLGRSNVGKSTFLNTIVGRKQIARTSAKPGKTQTLNFYLVNGSIIFVDVPGYGYASSSKEQKKAFGGMIEQYLQTRSTLKRAFLLVDIRHEPTPDDVLMIGYLKHFKIPTTVVATKADKVGSTRLASYVHAIKKTLSIASDDGVVVFSSETKRGLPEIHAWFEEDPINS